MTWPASSITVAFQSSPSVTVVINGSLDALPPGDESLIDQSVTFFPWSYFQARARPCCSTLRSLAAAAVFLQHRLLSAPALPSPASLSYFQAWPGTAFAFSCS